MGTSNETAAVLALCKELGFAAAGVVEAAPSKWEGQLRDWLSAGKHGSMGYLEENLEVRLNPDLLLPGARAMIMVADLYASRNEPRRATAPGMGRIARYAQGRDYHTVIKKRLHTLCDRLREKHPAAEFRAFVDTAPVLEREHAARAGLGWIGKHTLLIHARLGSMMLLGGVATTMELPEPGDQSAIPDHCGTCTRCIEACPTQAISPYSIDATRCISYLTIERRLPIDTGFHPAMGDWVFGCDVCQDVCPHNSPRPEAVGNPNPEYAPVRIGFDLLKVLAWTEEDRRREFQGSSMKRATLAMMKRNAVIAAGNLLNRTPNPAVIAAVRGVADDPAEPEMARAAAALVLSGLTRSG